MKEELINHFLLTFHDIMNVVDKIENHVMNFGTNEKLTTEEIHLITSIYDNPGSHVTGLAEINNVTKGAISQMLKKLDRKGMIIKSKDPDNLSRLIISLTDKGRIAYIGHEDFHKEFNEVLLKMFEGFSDNEIEVLSKFGDQSLKTLREYSDKL